MSDELRTLRDRQAAAAGAADRQPPRPAAGNAAEVVQTFAETTYPTSATAFFACSPLLVTGDEAEGSSATYTIDATTVYYALNIGSQIPPSGTKLIIEDVGNRWIFEYDG